MKITGLFFLIFISFFFITGCGGGGNSIVINPTAIPSAQTGSTALTVQGIFVPSLATITIEIQDAEGVTMKTDEIKAVSSETSYSKLISDITAGEIRIILAGLDSGGNILCHCIKKSTVYTGQTANITANMGVTIQNGMFLPRNISVFANCSLCFNNSDPQNYTVKFGNASIELKPYGENFYTCGTTMEPMELYIGYSYYSSAIDNGVIYMFYP